MNRSARVESIDAVQALRVAIPRFQEDASDALVAIQQEIHRFLDWLEHDQLKYWALQMRRASERVGEARSDLERKQVFTVGGVAPPCYDERKALARAKQRYRFAEEKVAEIRRMRREVEHEVAETEARLSSLGDALLSDVPKAAALLDRTVTSLHAYADIGREAPSETTSSAKPTAGDANGADKDKPSRDRATGEDPESPETTP